MNSTIAKSALIIFRHSLGFQVIGNFKFTTSREFKQFAHKFISQLAPIYFGTNWKICDRETFVVEAQSTVNENKIVVEKDTE